MQSPTGSSVPAVFSFDSHEIRTVSINGDPWFVAKDVAETLGYAKPENAVKQHCKRSNTCPLESGGQVRHLTIIPEGDVFRLVVRSNLPSAEKFETWVMDEVLPSIRKTGTFGTPKLPTDPMDILRLTFAALEDSQKRVAAVEEKVQFLSDNVRLHQWQCYELKLAVNVKASEFHKKHGVEYKQLYPGLWNRLKVCMKVNSYAAIPAAKFEEALALVQSFTIAQMPDYVQAQVLGGAL